MKDIKKLLGKRIKELRKINNMTQQELAEKIDVDQRSLSAIECGINFPTKNFTKIAEVFNLPLKELFDFEHLEESPKNKRDFIIAAISKIDDKNLTIIYRLIFPFKLFCIFLFYHNISQFVPL